LAAKWGRQSCLQVAFQAAVDLNRPLARSAGIFSGFLSQRHRAAKLEKLVLK
jgi:hypothetical protein